MKAAIYKASVADFLLDINGVGDTVSEGQSVGVRLL